MTEFRITGHLVTAGHTVVEIWEDGQFLGSIYAADKAVRVVSRHLVPPVWSGVAGDVKTLTAKFNTQKN